MASNTLLKHHGHSSNKFNKFQLPNQFKKVGIALFLFAFILLFVNKFSFESDQFRAILKYTMLIGILLISISKEKVEDELITNLRMQSYSLAFIAGVFITLILPFIDFSIDSIFNSESAKFKDVGDFEILLLLLATQIIHFESLKKFYQ